jgi:outer membrane protein TolC
MMTKPRLGAVLLMISLISLFSNAQSDEKSLSLTLENCILKAMKNNLGVAIEVLNPEIRDLSVSIAKEKFLPTFNLNFYTTDQEQKSYSYLDSSDELKTSYNQYGLAYTQLFPTGGTLAITLDSSKYDTNQTGILINPSYRSNLRFDVTQPLLKDFGFKTNKKEIIVAQNYREISERELNLALQEIIYDVEYEYWNLVYALENLEIKENSLKLAQDLLEQNKKAVDAGTMAQVELLTTQTQIAAREADLLRARADIKNIDSKLKQIMNLAAEDPAAEFIRIIPTDTPYYERTEMRLDEAFAVAMENRPDMQALRISIKNSQVNVDYAKNQLLPSLDLSFSYWSPGVSGDQLIYDPDNPLGGSIGVIPGGRADAFKDVFGFKYNNWSLGVTLDLPLANLTSRAALAQAKVLLEQNTLQLQNQGKEVFTEIKIALTNVATDFERIQAYRAARELAERQLKAEEEKLRVGHSTNYFVLQYQNELAQYKAQEMKAIVDYNLSVAALNQSLGVSLKKKNITMGEILNK